jgi:hypothetical protein
MWDCIRLHDHRKCHLGDCKPYSERFCWIERAHFAVQRGLVFRLRVGEYGAFSALTKKMVGPNPAYRDVGKFGIAPSKHCVYTVLMRAHRQSKRISETLPVLSQELEQLLKDTGEAELASQVSGLEILDRCRCGDDFCASFYTQPKPNGAYGPGHRNVILEPAKGMLILDVVHDLIAHVEILHRDEIRQELLAILP